MIYFLVVVVTVVRTKEYIMCDKLKHKMSK